jgi:hypothetical protein
MMQQLFPLQLLTENHRDRNRGLARTVVQRPEGTCLDPTEAGPITFWSTVSGIVRSSVLATVKLRGTCGGVSAQV